MSTRNRSAKEVYRDLHPGIITAIAFILTFIVGYIIPANPLQGDGMSGAVVFIICSFALFIPQWSLQKEHQEELKAQEALEKKPKRKRNPAKKKKRRKG